MSILSLLLQEAASLNGLRGVNGGIAFFDVLDFAVLIYDEGGAHAEASGFVEDAVIFHCFTCYEIAEYGEGKPFGFWRQFAFGPIFERWNAIYAEAENFGVSVGKFGDISLIRLHLARSATCKSQHEDGQHDIIFAPEITQLICFAIG
jgi:hypothetical protein